MKLSFAAHLTTFCGILSAAALLAGCTAPQGNAPAAQQGSRTAATAERRGAADADRPADAQPAASRRAGVRSAASAIPINVVKFVPTTPPGARAKKIRTREVPINTSIPFLFSIDDAKWPGEIDSVTITVKCYQVASVWTTTGGYTIKTIGSPINVFPSNPLVITLTKGGVPIEAVATFPSSAAGKQIIVGAVGSKVGPSTATHDFGGGNIFVLNY